MVTLVEFIGESISSSYIGKLKEFFDYIRYTGGRLNGMSLTGRARFYPQVGVSG